MTRIAQWNQVVKSTGHEPEGLKSKPELMDEIGYIWNEYCEIVKGCERVTWSELQAYENLTGLELTPWESSIMIELESMRRTSG